MTLLALLIGLFVERLATQLFHLRRLRWLDRAIDAGFRQGRQGRQLAAAHSCRYPCHLDLYCLLQGFGSDLAIGGLDFHFWCFRSLFCFSRWAPKTSAMMLPNTVGQLRTTTLCELQKRQDR